MKKRSVIVDVDDTLAQTQQAILAYVNQQSSVQYTLADLLQASQYPGSTCTRLAQRVFEQHGHLLVNFPAYPGILEAMQALDQASLKINIVTARSHRHHHFTEQWLNRNGLLPYIAQIYTRPEELSAPAHKHQVSQAEHTIAAFDDTWEVATAIAAGGVLTYLISHPWNQQLALRPGMQRVETFAAAVSDLLTPVGESDGSMVNPQPLGSR